ncbi:MAG TPA: hypothetical protein VJB08_00545 [Candidatus Nanoarchaeia archaeon]|nr:hypothetical protein [Candidatus Nanoarchaeia archaeon]
MGKKSDIQELVNLMAKALRHHIGSQVNKNEFYAAKYAKDAEIIMKEAETVGMRQNWNREDKEKIRKRLKTKLRKELEEKEFLDDRKFEIMDEEIAKALKSFSLGY